MRIEIATALTQAKRVIPVLIDDLPMPRSEDLLVKALEVWTYFVGVHILLRFSVNSSETILD